MKKCTMLLALVAAMTVSPLVVNANCGSCGTSTKKEAKKSCCPDNKECKKASCSKESCKDGCKCTKETKKSCCGSSKCKKSE